MLDPFVMIFVTSLAAGAAALIALVTALQLIAKASARNVDIDLYYEDMDEPKRNFSGDSGLEALSRTAKFRLAALYMFGTAVLIALVLRIVIALSLSLNAAIPVVLIAWLAIVAVPLLAVYKRRTKRLAALEIASILQLVARGEESPGAGWDIRSTKKVMGGDLLGEEEEDKFVLHLSRSQSAPIVIRTRGVIVVADAGLGRTVRKNVLRQLRLEGWFVNEISDTQVEIVREWSLRDSSYADIAGYLTWLIEALGLPSGSIRLSPTEPDNAEAYAPSSRLQQ